MLTGVTTDIRELGFREMPVSIRFGSPELCTTKGVSFLGNGTGAEGGTIVGGT